jgi:UDP-N-acetylmuramoylalanine--D-glutamate ligase
MHRTIIEFKTLEFHIEDVGFVNGIRIVNDSYGSNPTATRAALDTIAGSKVLILGGHTKGFEFNELMKVLDKSDVTAVVIIGADQTHCQKLADLIRKHSSAHIDIVGEQKMDTIFRRALKLADERTTILFSPAHASFDMYTNFNQRGRLFTEAVQNHEGFRETS